MKKILFLLLIGSGLLVASCTKNYAVVPNQTVYADLKSTDWGTANGGLTDTVLIQSQHGSNFGLSSDGILIYLSFDGGASYEQIPYVYDNVNYSYAYNGGAIELYAQSADGTKVIATPPASKAKIILVPSN
jgi:hypothetical protein